MTKTIKDIFQKRRKEAGHASPVGSSSLIYGFSYPRCQVLFPGEQCKQYLKWVFFWSHGFNLPYKDPIALSEGEVNWCHCSHNLGKARWKSRTRERSLLGKEEKKPFLGRLLVAIPLKVLRHKVSSAPGAELKAVVWEVGSSVPLGTCHHLLCFS